MNNARFLAISRFSMHEQRSVMHCLQPATRNRSASEEREAFRVAPAVTKVDSSLRDTSGEDAAGPRPPWPKVRLHRQPANEHQQRISPQAKILVAECLPSSRLPTNQQTSITFSFSSGDGVAGSKPPQAPPPNRPANSNNIFLFK